MWDEKLTKINYVIHLNLKVKQRQKAVNFNNDYNKKTAFSLHIFLPFTSCYAKKKYSKNRALI